MISELSPSQWAQVARLREEWITTAASCGAADREAAEAAISSIYRSVGRPPPRFVWFDGPATPSLVCTLQRLVRHPVFPGTGRPIAAVIRESAWFSRGLEPSLARALSNALGPDLRRALGRVILGAATGRWRAGPLMDVLGDWLSDQGDDVPPGEPGVAAGGSLPDGSLGGPLEESLLGYVPRWVEDCLEVAAGGVAGEILGAYPMWQLAIPEISLRYPARDISRGARFDGQFDADWIAFFDIPRQLGLVSYPESTSAWLDDWVTLARSCGWWWPYENVCIVSGRPSILRTDSALQLHNADGPAMAFGDGFAIYCWHGRVVPAWVIEEPTTERIFHESNVEIRRCAIESRGWEAFIGDLPGVPATAPDPGNPGQQLRLYELPPRGSGWWYHVRLLVCANGTPEADGSRHLFGIFVPRHITDPVGAAAWTYGLTKKQYLRLERRA
jgi:hypothetical protein